MRMAWGESFVPMQLSTIQLQSWKRSTCQWRQLRCQYQPSGTNNRSFATTDTFKRRLKTHSVFAAFCSVTLQPLGQLSFDIIQDAS